MTVLIYVNTSKQVGDPDHLKVFANVEAASRNRDSTHRPSIGIVITAECL